MDAVSRKVGEEALEVVMAAKDDAPPGAMSAARALTGELADLLYHSLVLMQERGLEPRSVIESSGRATRDSGTAAASRDSGSPSRRGSDRSDAEPARMMAWRLRLPGGKRIGTLHEVRQQ